MTLSQRIPFWKKYTLSIDEAAAYFRIGRDKLYKLVSENKDADFIVICLESRLSMWYN